VTVLLVLIKKKICTVNLLRLGIVRVNMKTNVIKSGPFSHDPPATSKLFLYIIYDVTCSWLGITIVNFVPISGCDSICTVPRNFSTASLTMYKPIPEPAELLSAR